MDVKPPILMVVCILLAACLTLYGDESAVSDIDDLLAAGKHEEGLQAVLKARSALPASKRVTAWDIDYGGEVWRVARGKECLYYLLHLSNARKDAPGRQAALPSVSANYSRSDWRHTVVCVDLKTGKNRWSREVNGLAYLAVDPRTDILYIYRERVVALDPTNGQVTEEHDVPKEKRGIAGLLLGSRLVVTHLNSERFPKFGSLRVYAPQTRRVTEVRSEDFWLVAPDESHRLLRTEAGWDCVGLPDRQKRWSLGASPAHISIHDHLPVWHDGHPIFVSGTEWQRGSVTCIDRVTGEPRWSTPLGWGLYTPGQHQLRGGGYQDLWTPLAQLDEHILALDGSGRLYLLDPDNGRPVATPQLARDYLLMPFQYGNQLIVPSFTSLRSYSLEDLLRPADSVDMALQVRQARCLLALGRSEEALQLLDGLVERMPESEAAWAERASLCAAVGQPEEEAFSLGRAMASGGRVTDEALRSRYGLLRQFDLGGKPTWTVAKADNQVCAGTLSGSVWCVDAGSLDIDRIADLDHEISSLAATVELEAVLGDARHTHRPLTPKSPEGDDRIPGEWHTRGGEERISSAVAYKGRQFRSKRGGGVRVLDGSTMTDLDPVMEGVEDWAIQVDPAGPLGCGDGVFELDDDLRPKRRLIQLTVDGKTPERAQVVFMSSTSRTIGLVVGSSNGAALQVYSRQGSLLNEAPLGRFVSRSAQGAQLIPVGDGYLFSDRQLVWISSNPDRGVWTFGPALTRTSTDRWGDRWRYYGNPLLSESCLYVTGLDGQLFVFDTTLLTGTGD